MKKYSLLLIAISISFTLLIFSCTEFLYAKESSLVVTLPPGRFITNPDGVIISKYTVSLQNKEGQTQIQTGEAGQSLIFENLPFGEYLVYAEAYNEDKNCVAYANQKVEVSSSEATAVILNLTWNLLTQGLVNNDEVKFEVTPLNKTIYNCGETFDSTGLKVEAVFENGYHQEIPIQIQNDNDSTSQSIYYDFSSECLGSDTNPYEIIFGKDTSVRIIINWAMEADKGEVTIDLAFTLKQADHTYTNGVCVCGMREMALIPAGTFQMGSTVGNDDEKPVHEVTITKDFYMGKYEVTQTEYEKYCNYVEETPTASNKGVGDNYPVYNVSWYDALVYCNIRSIAEGFTPCYSINGSTNPSTWGTAPSDSNNTTWNAVTCNWNADGYRLPTEAEWEYAARAGDNTVDSDIWSGTSVESEVGDYAWYNANAGGIAQEVGSKKPNAFYLYDMSGNISEWCWDWEAVYEAEGVIDPTGAQSSPDNARIYRGGARTLNEGWCTVTYRGGRDPSNRGYLTGFRVVRLAN